MKLSDVASGKINLNKPFKEAVAVRVPKKDTTKRALPKVSTNRQTATRSARQNKNTANTTKTIVKTLTKSVNDMFDKNETYVDKLKRGNMGGGALNFIGTGIQGAQSLYLNALNGASSLATGRGMPKFKYNMDFTDYEKSVANKFDGKPMSASIKNPVLREAYKTAMDIGSDPIELTPLGMLNDFKAAKGAAEGSKAYLKDMERNAIKNNGMVAAPIKATTEKIPVVGGDGKIRYVRRVMPRYRKKRTVDQLLNMANAQPTGNTYVDRRTVPGDAMQGDAPDVFERAEGKPNTAKADGVKMKYLDNSIFFRLDNGVADVSGHIPKGGEKPFIDQIYYSRDLAQDVTSKANIPAEHRGQGTVTKAVEKTLDYLKRSGHSEFQVKVMNEDSKRLMDRLVYSGKVEQVSRYRFDGDDVLYRIPESGASKNYKQKRNEPFKTGPANNGYPGDSSLLDNSMPNSVNDVKGDQIEKANSGDLTARLELLGEDHAEYLKEKSDFRGDSSGIEPDKYRSDDLYKNDLEKDATYKLNGKASRYQKRQENLFLNDVSEILGVNKYADRAGIKSNINTAMEKLKSGKLTKQDKTELFEEIYNNGIISMTKFYEEYKPAKDHIKNSKLKVDAGIKNEISDFEAFRKNNFGVLKLSEEGTRIDVFYDELKELYPGLLKDVNTQGEMLSEISNVAKSIKKTEIDLDSYLGGDAAEFKEYAREEFEKQLENLRTEAGVINKYTADQNVKDVFEEVSEAEIRKIYEMAAPLRKNIDKLQNATLLTKKDIVQVDRLLKGEITEKEIAKGINASGVMKMYRAKKELDDLMKPIEDYNARYKGSLRSRADELLDNSDNWKDKKVGLRYARETQERNFIDVAGEDGEALIKEYVEPVHVNEANSTRMKNTYREKVKLLNLSSHEKYNTKSIPNEIFGTNVKRGKISERALVQMYGEGKITDEQLRFTGADVDKIKKSADAMRGVYNELIEKANSVLMKNGYKPIEYRRDYFPHFEDDIPDSVLGKIAKKLGFDVVQDELPTDIAGLTHMFRPGKKWFSNALQRKGDSTVFDAVRGFDGYLEGVSDVINHTDDIQRLRALENSIRYKYSKDGMKEQIDKILNSDEIESMKQAQLDELYQVSKSQLSNFAQNIRSYTDNLAGKKSLKDRGWEEDFGRGIYNTLKQAENRVAANMVAINPASWLTNFIPLFQGTEVSVGSTLKALSQTMRAMVKDDGFKEISNFLTNRAGSEALSKTKPETVINTLSGPMRMIDRFTSEVLSRSKYYDEIANGSTADEAILASDKFAASVIADRSKGSLPTLFNSRNPVNKLLTMFQVEVNNQYSYLFKDLPRNMQEKGKAALVIALTQYAVGSFLYNSAYEHFIGRRPAFDPIGILIDGYEKATGLAILGEETGEDPSASKAIGVMGKDIAENIPFVGGLIGGGRIPISSALPNVPKLVNSATGYVTGEINKNKAKQDVFNELVKPAYYMIPPAGGGQIKKVVDTYNVMKGGGDYVYDAEGNRKMRFPTNVNAKTIAQSAVFGKYALPEGKEYINGGFKMLSPTVTEGWIEARKNGVTASEFMETHKSVKGIVGDKDDKGRIIKNSKSNKIRLKIDEMYPNLPLEKKIPLYNAFKVSEKVYKTDPVLIGMSGKKVGIYNDSLKSTGMSAIDYLNIVNGLDQNGSGRISQDEAKSSLDQMSISNEQKSLIYDAHTTGKKANPYISFLENSQPKTSGGKIENVPVSTDFEIPSTADDFIESMFKDPHYTTSDFGEVRGGVTHQGRDIGTNGKKIPVYSPVPGKVIDAGFNRVYGNYIVIDYPEVNQMAMLKHLNEYNWKKGEIIPAGSQIGKTGTTGSDSTGIHLHFEWLNRQ